MKNTVKIMIKIVKVKNKSYILLSFVLTKILLTNIISRLKNKLYKFFFNYIILLAYILIKKIFLIVLEKINYKQL